MSVDRAAVTAVTHADVVAVPDSNRRGVQFRDAITGRELGRIAFDGTIAWQPLLSPDARLFAAVIDPDPNSRNDTRYVLHIRRVPSGESVLTIPGGYASATFSADGRWMAVAKRDITIFEAATGRELRKFTPKSNGYGKAFAIHPDGRRVLRSVRTKLSDDPPYRDLGEVEVWDSETGKMLFAHRGHLVNGRSEAVSIMALSRDGSRLATSGSNGTVTLWNPDTGAEVRTFRGSGWVSSLLFSADGRHLFASYKDLIQQWDADTGAELRTFRDARGQLGISPDGQRLTAADYQSYCLWDLAEDPESSVWKGPIGHVCQIAFSPDGRLCATAIVDASPNVGDVGFGQVRVCDSATGTEAWVSPRQRGPVRCAVFLPDGRLVTAGQGPVRFWEAATGKELAAWDAGPGWVNELAVSPDGKWLAAACGEQDAGGAHVIGGNKDHTLRLWDVASGRLVRGWQPHNDVVSGVAFLDGGRVLATTDDRGHLRAWAVPEGQTPLWEVLAPPSGTLDRHRLTADRDGNRLYVAGGLAGTGIRDGRTGGILAPLAGAHGFIQEPRPALSPDGRRVALAIRPERRVQLWDAETGQEVLSLPTRADPRSVVFSPDGHRLFAGLVDGSIQVWDSRPFRDSRPPDPKPIFVPPPRLVK